MKHLHFIIGCATLVLVAGSSCQKNTDCKATVRCVDDKGEALKNTSVYLYAPVKAGPTSPTIIADVTASAVTDDEGCARFTFKLPAVYDIKATSTVGTKAVAGTGIIRLEEGKGSEKTVVLK
jgi:hypothetical protein